MCRDIKPDFSYLNAKLSITNADTLIEKILDKCDQLDMEKMAKDVSPFLFEASETKK